MVPLIGIQGSRFPALIAEWDQLGEQFQKQIGSCLSSDPSRQEAAGTVNRSDKALVPSGGFANEPPPIPATQLLGTVDQKNRRVGLVKTPVEELGLLPAVERRAGQPTNSAASLQSGLELLQQRCLASAVWATDGCSPTHCNQSRPFGFPSGGRKTEGQTVSTSHGKRIESGWTNLFSTRARDTICHVSGSPGWASWISRAPGPITSSTMWPSPSGSGTASKPQLSEINFPEKL